MAHVPLSVAEKTFIVHGVQVSKKILSIIPVGEDFLLNGVCRKISGQTEGLAGITGQWKLSQE